MHLFCSLFCLQAFVWSVLNVKPVTPEEAQSLKVGDTVTYLLDSKGTKITHKIYEVVGPAYLKNQYGEYLLDENGQPIVAKDDFGNPIIMYTTYGINNKNTSSPHGYTLDGKLGVGNLGSSNVYGKPLFSIPLLGYVAHFVQNPPGKYITVIVSSFLILISLLGDMFKKKPEDGATLQDAPADEGQTPTRQEPPASSDASPCENTPTEDKPTN